MKICSILICIIFIVSCSSFQGGGGKPFSIKRSSKTYSLTESSGNFIVKREIGLRKGNKSFVVKREVFSVSDTRKILEKSITISEIGLLKDKLRVMRPEASQFKVWFDGKEYSTNMKLNKASRTLDISMSSPEPQWSGQKSIPFPRDGVVFCFFSQLVECAGITGFLEKAIKNNNGKMNLYIIWDGYPYFQEQYLNVQSTVFSKAVLKYDGSNSYAERRFTLEASGQSIFYLVDKTLNFYKMLCVSQGLSMVPANN